MKSKAATKKAEKMRPNLWGENPIKSSLRNSRLMREIPSHGNEEEEEEYDYFRNGIACGILVSLQICSVFAFISSYCYMTENGGETVVLSVNSALILCGYYFLTPDSLIGSHLHLLTVFAFVTVGLADVFRTLTETISTDTVHSMSGFLLLVHLFSHEYHPKCRPFSSSTLSLNSATFAAICLASRLDSRWQVVALLAVAATAFALFPLCRNKLRPEWGLVTMASVITLSFYAISAAFGLFAIFLNSFTAFGFPALYGRWHKIYRHTKHGPWDEAVPKL